jgi:hypothetical protein
MCLMESQKLKESYGLSIFSRRCEETPRTGGVHPYLITRIYILLLYNSILDKKFFITILIKNKTSFNFYLWSSL